MKSLVIAIALLSLTACDRAASQMQENKTHTTKSSIAAKADDTTPATADAWAGKWAAANGDYIEITPTENADYTIFVKGGPDGPSAYQARAEAGMLRFSRAGEELTVSMASTDCIALATGDTYCRNSGLRSVYRSDI